MTEKPPLDMQALRELNEEVDRRILIELRHRMSIVEDVAQFKLDAAIPLRDRLREEKVLGRVRSFAVESGLFVWSSRTLRLWLSADRFCVPIVTSKRNPSLTRRVRRVGFSKGMIRPSQRSRASRRPRFTVWRFSVEKCRPKKATTHDSLKSPGKRRPVRKVAPSKHHCCSNWVTNQDSSGRFCAPFLNTGSIFARSNLGRFWGNRFNIGSISTWKGIRLRPRLQLPWSKSRRSFRFFEFSVPIRGTRRERGFSRRCASPTTRTF